jgi:hypothetical protein
MKTNAGRIAHRAAMREFKRQQIMSRAIKAMATSVESINADDDCTNKREAINESLEQCQEWLTKSYAELARGDDADDEDREDRIDEEDDGDDGENTGDTTFRGLGDKERKEKAMAKDSLQSIVKQYGVIAVAKMIADEGDAHGITQDELVDLIGKHEPKAGESAAQCFTRHYTSNIEVRKAVQVVSLAPLYVGGEANRGGDVNPNNPKSALAQINALVEEARKSAPFKKTTAQLFAEVYAMRPDLAQREREENRPKGHPSFMGFPPRAERERTRFPNSAYEPDMGRSDER